MESFPQQHELISFFEAEPVVTDPGVPWGYNELRFVTQRELDLIECEIAPGYESIRLRWSRDRTLLVKLDLTGVRTIQIETPNGTEVLVIEFRAEFLRPLRLQLKPAVSIEWGTDAGS